VVLWPQDESVGRDPRRRLSGTSGEAGRDVRGSESNPDVKNGE